MSNWVLVASCPSAAYPPWPPLSCSLGSGSLPVTFGLGQCLLPASALEKGARWREKRMGTHVPWLGQGVGVRGELDAPPQACLPIIHRAGGPFLCLSPTRQEGCSSASGGDPKSTPSDFVPITLQPPPLPLNQRPCPARGCQGSHSFPASVLLGEVCLAPVPSSPLCDDLERTIYNGHLRSHSRREVGLNKE